MGSFDERGFLTLRDRSKDVVISGGSNIYPREVEEILLEHPGVDEAGVVGAPDEEWGEVVVAFIVGSASAAELDAHLLERIARFKRPKRYEFIDELPKNSYGKVLKRDAARAAHQIARAGPTPQVGERKSARHAAVSGHLCVCSPQRMAVRSMATCASSSPVDTARLP